VGEAEGPYQAARLSGDEQLPAGTRVGDFWRWIGSDLVGNTTRGLFAEYLVGLAVGALTGDESDGVRDEWAAHDLVTPEGTTIEVKSSAYLQTWRQHSRPNPRFRIAPTQAWDDEVGDYRGEQVRQAEVYVFCLLRHADKATLNPLDMRQWTFFVLATAALNEKAKGQKTIGLTRLGELGAMEVAFDGIAAAVREAARPS